MTWEHWSHTRNKLIHKKEIKMRNQPLAQLQLLTLVYEIPNKVERERVEVKEEKRNNHKQVLRIKQLIQSKKIFFVMEFKCV